jgi:hypothetical protein
MKKLFLIPALVASALPAFADLGDTYAQSVHAYGRPSGSKGTIVWWAPRSSNRSWLGETFYHNQCVAVYYVFTNGYVFAESEIWRVFQLNSRPGATWEQYGSDADGFDYANNDGTLYGKLTRDGHMLRICYKSFLARHGLFTAPSEPERPPVEDNSDGTNM